MAKDPESDLPEFVRRCWDSYQSATTHLREASKESLKMWLGGEHQWRPVEIAARVASNRPYITINRLKPVVDQVENEARNNPPGPEALPVGSQADKDGADIMCGTIREYEYRSNAHRAYVTALRYAAAGNYGLFEMATEYAGERTFDQRITIKEAEDPAMYFVDPDARMAYREDAMWAGKIRVLSREKLIEEYGSGLKILNRNLVDRAAGWMQSAVGWHGNQSSINMWTGGSRSEGPFYVCEFYRVKVERDTLREYSDGILRFDDEKPPKGVTVKTDDDGEISRVEPRRKVKKYVVTALDVIDETDWYGDIIPYFWVLGPEMYIDGKLYRLSLIDGAKDSQRGLNYAATSAAEIVNSMTKAPWVGWLGQFDVANAQGMNPWESSNTQTWAYLEVKPIFATNPVTGESSLLSAPQRNTWEAPIQRLLELATFFIEGIKGATSVFFDPSVQSVRDAQSGEAIKALQSQTNIGTFNWQNTLHGAVSLSYGQAAKILPRIMDGPREITIVRPDSQHEIVEINREFPANGIDPKTGKKGKTNNITLGEYSLRVTAGPSFQTRTQQSIEAINEVFKIAPALLNAPGVAARFLRMVGEGSPQVEEMADSLMGNQSGDGEQTPEQLQNQLMQLHQQGQAKDMLIQKMQQALQSKLPQVEADKWIAAVRAIAQIRAAEITASKDRDNAQADRDAAQFEQLTTMAHESALQATDHEHQADQAQQAQQAQAAQTQQAQQQAQQSQPTQ